MDGMSSPSDAVSTYIFAKDGNRPFLMRRAFAEDAELETVVKTDAISFPSSAKGSSAIAEILGRSFGLAYENVYTFCLSRPSEANRRHFPCHWLVGMSARSNGEIRVGCGRYDWYFRRDNECLVERLVIAIDVMQIFPATQLAACMNWFSCLPYPWCTPDQALRAAPAIDGLAEIKAYLANVRPIPAERQAGALVSCAVRLILGASFPARIDRWAP
jgi:hypothetical protein